ncbi:MAG: DUF2974 domain-containing protein [Clostridia bacterium]|nr:DUF2974 domain-containing protein [Clostridia bacterium]
MPDLFEYLSWRGDLSFEQVPLTEADNLIFTMLSYVKFGSLIPTFESKATVSLAEAAEAYKPQGGEVDELVPNRSISQTILRLLQAAAKTPRFGNVRLLGYVDRLDDVEQKQFSALTACLSDGSAYVAFRGTDATIVGWKEDFNMSYRSPIPSQLEATAYLNRAGRAHPGPLYVGGHSKGGNLAVYAGVHCLREVKDRILAVYNNDGPGFDREAMFEEGYRELSPRIRTYIPAYSVVGMLFERLEEHTVVESRGNKIMQHDGMSWEIMGGSFVRAADIEPDTKRIDRIMKEWVSSMKKEDREAYVNTVYAMLASTEAKNLSDLSRSGLKLLRAYLTLDPSSREVIHENTKAFLSCYKKNRK